MRTFYEQSIPKIGTELEQEHKRSIDFNHLQSENDSYL